MAEQFLEEIYTNSMMIDDLRQCVNLVAKTDYYNARIMVNRAMSQLETSLEQYAKEDPSSANRIQSAAIKAVESWGNWSYMTGTINGELIPLLYEYMKLFNTIEVEDRGYLLQSTDSGFLTIKDIAADVYIHDTFDPMLEAEKTAEVIYSPKVEKYIFLGCGLGYLAYKIWKKSDEAAEIIIFEDDKNIIEYAEHYGVLGWIDKSFLDVRYESDQNKLIEAFYKEVDLTDESKVTFVTPYKKKKYKDAYGGKFLALTYRIEYVWISREVTETNLWKNRRLRSVPFNKLYQRLNSDEWVVVAAGPSLNYSMDFIKEAVGDKRIVAVNTVLRKFCKEEIVPDLSVAADPFGQIPEHLDGIEKFTRNIPLIADWLLCWRYSYRYQGEKCFIPTPAGECIRGYNPENEDVWDVFGTVSALGIEAALRLGAKKIYLVGLDLAFPGGVVHANDMPHEKIGYKSEAITVPSVNGSSVETTPVFNDFRIGIEEIIARNPSIEFVNMSHDGAYIKGAKKGW